MTPSIVSRRKGLRGIALAAPVLAAALGAAPVRAEGAGKTVEVATLHKLVEGLGLDDVGDKGSAAVKIESQGGYTYYVYMRPSDDKSFMTIYVRLKTIPKEKMAQLPLLKLMQFNDSHLFTFAVSTTDAGENTPTINAPVALEAVTPQNLRRYLDFVVADADETSELWDWEKWGGAATGGAKVKSAQ